MATLEQDTSRHHWYKAETQHQHKTTLVQGTLVTRQHRHKLLGHKACNSGTSYVVTRHAIVARAICSQGRTATRQCGNNAAA